MADILPARSPTDLFGDPIEAKPPWFKSSNFLRADFDPESYVADLRSFVPLENLAAELRSHFADLKAELVDLINRDYADFIGLSTRLVDVDSAATRMRAPLVEFRDKVAAFRAVVDAALTSIRNGLRQRAEASAAREILELLLDTFHVVSKVEKLIKELPGTHSNLSSTEIISAEKGSLSDANGTQNTENGANLREDQSILLERIASEMNRLKFYTSHAKNLPFIENMEKRIHNATLMLDGSLGNCFVDGLEHRDVKTIYNCLRAYAAIDNTSAAEELFGQPLCPPLIQRIIPYDHMQVVGAAPSDQLEEDYQQIMHCVEKDCKFFLEISSTANSGFHVFDFLANSILKEVLIAIQRGKPGAFSPGRPAEFLKNYKSSLGFLAFLEGYCPSRLAVVKFRSEDVYVDFLRQWNVGVYFSLRFQEIAGALDSALMVATIKPVDTKGKPHTLTLKQSMTLMQSLKSCWSDDVLVISHSDKFLRLSLQLVSRYSTWLSHGLSARKTRNATQNPSHNSEWAISAQVEDFVYAMHDVTFLVSELSGDYLRQVIRVLGSCAGEVVDLVRRSILEAVKTLEDLLPPIMDTVIEAIVEKSVEDLRQLKGVTATYRMTNKLPVRPSPYVSLILRPLKAFFDGEFIQLLTKDAQNELLNGATEKITNRYYELAADTVNVARKTESSLMRLRQGAQRRVGATSDALDNNISDTEKICMQLFLDIQEYGRNLAAMGVEATKISAYRSLWEHFVPNLTIGAPVIESLRKHIKAYLDCHLMVTNPLDYVEPLAKAGASGFTFHVEVTKDYWQEIIHRIKTKGMRAGVALKPGTPVDEVYPLLEGENPVELVLVMTVEPGFGGQNFMPEMMDKVSALRKKYPSLDIEVDGGLGPSTIDLAAVAGANCIVAGSSIFGAKDPAEVISILRSSVEAAQQNSR